MLTSLKMHFVKLFCAVSFILKRDYLKWVLVTVVIGEVVMQPTSGITKHILCSLLIVLLSCNSHRLAEFRSR